MTPSMPRITQALAAFTVDHDEPLPLDAREATKRHVVDTLAAVVAAVDQPWTVAAREVAFAEASSGRSQVIGDSRTLTAPMAAMVNGTAAHGTEIDDYHVPAAVHAGCVAVPAALAVAQEIDASARDTLTAITLAYESIIRLGLALSPEMTQDRGFHVTSVFGPIGAAIATARLTGSSSEVTLSALGIAAAQAGGTTEYTRTGGEVKRLHAGFAAAAGIRAVRLARAGATAPTASLEGDRGLIQAVAGRRADIEKIVDGLGEQWSLDGLGIKAWATCTGNHPAIAALEELIDHGLCADRVARVQVLTDNTTAHHCGRLGPTVHDLTGAQFSLHVTLALRLVGGGNDVTDYIGGVGAPPWEDPGVIQFASRVEVRADAEHERWFNLEPKATVIVTTTDGESLRATAHAPGNPRKAYGWDEVEAKVRRNTRHVIGGSAVDGLLSAVRDETPVRGWLPRVQCIERGRTREVES